MSISGRKEIRWLPLGEPEGEWQEFTSTLVLTSRKESFYTDIRVFDNQLPPSPAFAASFPSPPSPVSSTSLKPAYTKGSLAWAFAGQSKSVSAKDEDGKALRTTTWHHWIDSNYHHEVSDEGTMWERPDGTTLEKGSMMNTDTNRVEPYEEAWREFDVEAITSMASKPSTPTIASKPNTGARSGSGSGPSHPLKGRAKSTPQHKVSMVLQGENEALSIRGLIVRVGGWCQGIIKINNDTTVERWRWLEGDGAIQAGWEQVCKIGTGSLPCRVLWEKEDLEVGDGPMSGGLTWKVMEKEIWQ